MGRKYYIKFGISDRQNAGSKAMRDVMHLLDTQGYHAMPALPTTANRWMKLIVDIPLLCCITLFCVRRSGTILYIMPSNANRIRLLYRMKRILGFRLICFINDVEQLRMPTSAKYAHDEIASIGLADEVLAPNLNSITILRHQFQLTNHLIPVGVWDYLSNYQPSESMDGWNEIHKQSLIAYAGNLQKSPFIAQLGELTLPFRIWGDGWQDAFPSNVSHQGATNPDQLPPLLHDCAWGLVWDGSTINTCDGQLGTYLRFNNAHKCGLYLSAGLPLVVWKESGMAHFVKTRQVGILIESLRELPQLIKTITPEQYATFRKNACCEGELIRKGHYFLHALREIEQPTLTLLWRHFNPLEAGKDVVLVPQYLGRALQYRTQIVCGFSKEDLQQIPQTSREEIEFIHRSLSQNYKQRIPVYIKYLLGNAHKINILMCFHRKPETMVNVWLYKRLNKKGRVYVKLDTEAGNEWKTEQKRVRVRWLYNWANRIFARDCDVISCETEQGYRYLTEQSPYRSIMKEKLVLMPNAFDEETWQALQIPERSYDEKENLIITVGRIGTRQKNTEMLLKALRYTRIKNWKVALVGPIEPDFQSYLDDYFQENPTLKASIEITGPIYEKQKLWEYYNRAKVFVLTSEWESFGIVLTEARRFNNYILSTPVGDAENAIAHGSKGEIIPLNDTDYLSRALQSIIDGKKDIRVTTSQDENLSYSAAVTPVAQRLH